MNSVSVDSIILKHSTRGMDVLAKLHSKEHIKEAIKAFRKLKVGKVFLYTGFWVAGAPESDGPIGTYFLARALKALGYEPAIVTDKFCENLFKEIETLIVPIDKNVDFTKLLKEHAPVAHISIERCGKNRFGRYENSRKEDISKYTAPLDELFSLGENRFAIGDGGNEIGMGNYKEDIKRELGLEPCIVECDYLMLSSVSNWGAYGFIAYLDKKLLPSFEEVDEYLEFLISKGVVDGISKRCEKSVDGKEWEIEREILEELRGVKIKL